ncbi:MAG TPA: cbb3-type cytochrome c oxidase subunit 3 [Methylophilaceae bacterium]|jgi:cbb3-type cytochrome oxidase subunit 3
MELLLWFTKFENTKPVSLVIFFTLFCGVVFYLYGSKARGEMLEQFKQIPLLDELAGESKSNGEGKA